jgi:hypothetical protein
MLIQTLWAFPESPRFNYSKDRFGEAKENLQRVAYINGVRHFNPNNFKFDNEHQQEVLAQMMENQALSEQSARTVKKDGGNDYGITNRQYIINVILYSLLFSCFSFCFWLSDFQAEYLGTDMYILFYAQGAVCIVSG